MLFAIISITAFAQSRNFIDQPYLEKIVKVDTLVFTNQIFKSIYNNEGEDGNKISLEKQKNGGGLGRLGNRHKKNNKTTRSKQRF